MTLKIIKPFKLLPILLAIALSACGLFEPDPESYTSPRDMTWTVDTLAYPGSSQTFLTDFWGESPNNMYLVGHSATALGQLWHFYGSTWDAVPIHQAVGGPIAQGYHMFDIWGSSAHDIWIVGDSERPFGSPPKGIIIHYNGTEWAEVEGNFEYPLFGVWGRGPDDIYAVGAGGTVHHYDGSNWDLIQLPDIVQLNWIGGDDRAVFISGTDRREGRLIGQYMFRIDGAAYIINDYQPGNIHNQSPRFGSRIFSPKQGYIYSCNWALFSWNGLDWDKIIDPDRWMAIGGTAHDNLVVAGNHGYAMHWNGQDWQQLDLPIDLYPTNDALSDVWVGGGEVFMATYGGDNNATYIIHGK